MEKPSNSYNSRYECSYCKRMPNSEADQCNFKLCSGCYKVHYCKKECQLADRKKHKVTCSKLVSNDTISSKPIKLYDLLQYCDKGDFEGLQKLIAQGVDVKAISNEHFFTAFTKLIVSRFYNCAELLLQHKINPNVTDTVSGCTPLFIASSCGDEKFVSLLLKYNADPNILNTKTGGTCLHGACVKDYHNCVSLLLKFDANPDMVDSMFGLSPLHITCRSGYDMCTSLLLRHNADPNKVDKERYTPLLIACQNGHDKCIALLLQHKADPMKQ